MDLHRCCIRVSFRKLVKGGGAKGNVDDFGGGGGGHVQ